MTIFLSGLGISTLDDRGVFTVKAEVSNNTDFALQFVANAKKQCFLLAEPVPPIKSEKSHNTSLTLPMNVVTIKPHSSIEAEGSMDIGDRLIKNFKSINARVLQVTDASIRIKVKPNGDADYLPW